jgi:hypothetical protein
MSIVSSFFNGILINAEKGIVHGAVAGLNYFRQDIEISAWAIKTNNGQAIADCLAIDEQWIKETFDQYNQVLPEVTSAISAILSGQNPKVDPWIKSRQMTQALWSKYGAVAGFVAVVQPPIVPVPPVVPVSSVPTHVAPSRAAGIQGQPVNSVTVHSVVNTPDANGNPVYTVQPDLAADGQPQGSADVAEFQNG